MKCKKVIKILAVALCGFVLSLSLIGCAPTPTPTPTPTPKPTLIFGDLSWDSIQVHDRIAAFIAEHGYGYEVEFVAGETAPIWAGLRRGDVNIDMESWTENVQKVYDEAIGSGDCVDLGSNFPDSWQGWLVPTVMIENGDLPEGVSVKDMSQYWELFKDPEDPTKGRFVNSIPGWLCTDINSEKLKAYGLDKYYTDFLAGSDAALSGSMAAACQKGEPWFGYYWSPTWVLGKLDMTPIEEPPFDQAEWDAKTYGCAFSPTQVNIIVNSSLMEDAPDIVAFLKNYETTCEQNNKVLAYMQENKASTEDAALWFLKEYEPLWTEWVPADVASKVKAALP
ncbi:MAG: ABC transporter substrate-binding protein [Chloroflexota bacterium]|nr:ABC transporter substrate-binding protein [Chloroflexota bacterium]